MFLKSYQKALSYLCGTHAITAPLRIFYQACCYYSSQEAQIDMIADGFSSPTASIESLVTIETNQKGGNFHTSTAWFFHTKLHGIFRIGSCHQVLVSP